jgi:hypothetical protein
MSRGFIIQAMEPPVDKHDAELERTYRWFVRGVKWAAILQAVTLLLLAWFLLGT